jgi:poly(A) polymerase
LMKLVVAPHAVPTLVAMSDAGITLRVLGGVSYLAAFENMAKVEAAIGAAADAVRRLAALGVWIAEDAERLWQKLRLANNEHARLVAMSEDWWRISIGPDGTARRALLYRLGPQHFTDRVLIAWSRSQATAHDEAWHALATLPQHWSAPAFPLKAADLIERGVAPGPALGTAMRAAEEAWIETGFPEDAARLMEIADQAVKKL